MQQTTPSIDDDGISDPLRLFSVLGLRLGGLLCQILVVVMEVFVLGTSPNHLVTALVAMAAGAIGSIALWRLGRGRELPDSALTAAIVADIVVLTITLASTGGPHNPFTFFYVIHVATAVVVVDRLQAWAVAGAASVSFLVLFLLPVDHHALHDPTRMNLHMRGMWLAFVVTAAFVVLFVGQLRAALDARSRDRARLRTLADKSERLAALATLAGGAAHELATPLSTIAVVADDLQERLRGSDAAGGTDLVDDIALIAAEVRRCRTVLTQLAADAGTPQGEAVAVVAVADIVTDAVAILGDARRGAVVVDVTSTRTVRLPRRALTQAVRGLLKNAFEAGAATVTIRAIDGTDDDGDDRVRIVVDDDGDGFGTDVINKLGEPFVTTKAPGAGMGLGLFLTRTLVERFDGTLTLGAASTGRGARVTLTMHSAPGTSEQT